MIQIQITPKIFPNPYTKIHKLLWIILLTHKPANIEQSKQTNTQANKCKNITSLAYI